MFISQQQFDEFLLDISDCFIRNDFSQWHSRILLPFSLVTRARAINLNDAEELRRNFDLYILANKTMRVDQIIRIPLQLEDCGDGTWLGTYETRLVSRSTLATSPYVSTALLHIVGARVKMSSILNARGHYEWTQVDR